jgi:prepilin peptidase CpaA
MWAPVNFSEEIAMISIPLTLLIILLTFCAIIDVKKQKIPNVFTLPAIAIALLYYGVNGGVSGLAFSAGGLSIGMGMFLVFYVLGGMGAGDVKLMGAVGSILGFQATLSAILFTALAGGLYAIIILIAYPGYGKEFVKRAAVFIKGLIFSRQIILTPANEAVYKPKLYYGLAIAAGTLFSVWIEHLGFNLIT